MPSIALTAVTQAAIKRRLLAKAAAQRLIDYAGDAAGDHPAAIRAWLAKADGLHPDLARKLIGLLPSDDVKALGPYQPLAHLADGGMGSVWLAASTSAPGELVVVKTIKPAAGVSETHAAEAAKRFEREAKITRQLQHPNVVRCVDSGVADGQTLYLVLEYVDSGDLRDLVDAKGGLAEGLALAILYQVTDGLAEAHRLKLIHRDIKPPNVFVASNGLAKLADFGIARSTEESRTMLTMQGSIVGSPLYMSPEQILTDPTLDIRSDLYALGCMLWFCLAGEPPYNGKLQEILHQHCTAPVPSIRAKRSQISPAVEALLTKAMTKDRRQRFQTPEEFRLAIGEALTNLGMHPVAHSDESTPARDLREGTAKAVARDIANITADLRRKAGLDELPTVANETPDTSHQATIATDLSQDADLSEAATVPPPRPVSPDMATMAADLSGNDDGVGATQSTLAQPQVQHLRADMPTMTVDLNALASMTAVLIAQEPTSTLPTSLPRVDPGTSATVAIDDASALGTVARLLYGVDAPAAASTPKSTKGVSGATSGQALSIDGDLANALPATWLALLPTGTSSGTTADNTLVLLYPQASLTFGKLRESPVDLCLRNYPIAQHKESCQRISRQHGRIGYDATEQHCILTDLNAPNGTRLDGIPLKAGGSAPLPTGVDSILEVAGVVTLWLRPLPRRGAAVPTPTGHQPGTIGLDTPVGLDALIITRPENRPELAYAQVLRRISIGGPGSDLVLAGARSRASVDLAIIANRWIWRPVSTTPTTPASWKPLTAITDLDCGGRILRAGAANHELFG